MNLEQVNQLVTEAIDNEFVREGLEKGVPEETTRRELAENRRVADLYEEWLAAGYTDEQVSRLCAGKSTQDILAEADMNPNEKGTV